MIISKIVEKLNLQGYFSMKEMKTTFRLLTPYIFKYKKAYIGLIILLFVDIALTLAFAWFIGNITDAAVQSNFDRLKWLVVAGIGLSVFSIASNFIGTYLETVAVNAVKRDLNLHIYKHILLLQNKTISNTHSGEFFSHFSNDIHHVDGVIGSGLINLIRFPIVSIAAFIYLVQISWKLSLFTLIIAPIAVIGGSIFGLLLRNNSRIINELISKINRNLNDTFHGFTVIRSFTLERLFLKRYRKNNQDLYSLELKDAKIRGAFYAGGEAVGAVTYLVSLLVGAYFVSSHVITIGALLSFINLVNHMVYPFTGLASQWAGYQHSIAALERITNLLGKPTESIRLPSQYKSNLGLKNIELQNVTFSYDGNHHVFENLNLEIPAGKVTAFVGPSGAGKTTLFNLIQNFYQPQIGKIIIDHQSIHEITNSELRNSIAYVPQDTFLFSGTIRENISIARPEASETELMNAAIDANIHDYIISLPDGYDTEIGERGIKLSGGQKQRLAIARAILKDASILLLDEATSALDTETEFLVKEALNRLMKDRTTLVIAHRLSTIQHADLIVVMNKGKVVQTGKHEELINQKGLYRDLHGLDQVQEKQVITI